ncbi:MAG TPA: DUF222 domain-containing protein [Gemmataceae bacterium]|nr:DUF222 domain-containing protein [Gemmataceae bacterium]
MSVGVLDADPAAGSSSVSDAAVAAVAAVAVLRERLADPGVLTDAELSEFVRGLDELRDEIETARLSVLGVWDARAVWALDGAAGGATWISMHGRSSHAQASGAIKAARKLRTSMPVTAAWLADGRLAPAKARLLASAVNDRTAEMFARDEELLVAGAATLTVDGCAQMIKAWLLKADQEGPKPRDGEDDVCFLARTLGGRFDVKGSLGAEGGSILEAALDTVINEWRHAARDTDVGLPAAPRLRAQALIELAIRGASNDRPATKPLLWVLVPEANLVSGEGTAEIAGAGPVAATMAQRLACDADVSHVTLDEYGRIIDLGRTHRLASAVQRRLLAIRDDTCVWPGCHRPANWCEAHHIDWWEHGGPTDIDNLVLLCRHHHHRCHEGGFRLTGHGNGHLNFQRPDGSTLTAPPISV